MKKNLTPYPQIIDMLSYQKKISILIYLLLGFAYLYEGIRTLTENPHVCLPVHVHYNGDYTHYFMGVTQGVLHLFMDLSITYALVGITFIWSLYNYEKSEKLDYVLALFFLFSTVTHWNESFNEERDVNSPIFSLIPFLLLVIVIGIKRIKPPE